MTELKTELKKLVIDALDLEDVTVDDIDSSEPLFIDGLGLDSIDALELGLALQKTYGIKLAADSEETRKHFASIDSLAELVASHKAA
ncbi:phosphopantetheine-binding protein [Marinobacter persicus]|uniref:Acyl carrier protein n=1 Tax=Marinobacter persicus TaxID=930118 RepID=A0A2S6G837_9GAMM|nr:phosphopantetheine-binding protein [Marinobacter persicus]PPK52082.1 acyl carrier protein [Marinobacter persicus]PPK55230.1 acyl carrier protein [Marinobacter persicus]PPK58842.1 acyl carrier protein [Marinobacter persicus]